MKALVVSTLLIALAWTTPVQGQEFTLEPEVPANNPVQLTATLASEVLHHHGHFMHHVEVGLGIRQNFTAMTLIYNVRSEFIALAYDFEQPISRRALVPNLALRARVKIWGNSLNRERGQTHGTVTDEFIKISGGFSWNLPSNYNLSILYTKRYNCSGAYLIMHKSF